MDYQNIQLTQEDVVSLQDGTISLLNQTFLIEEFNDKLKKGIFRNTEEEANKWIDEGVQCKILSPQSHWKKGKIRIRLEFVPDDSDSPLDDVRSKE